MSAYLGTFSAYLVHQDMYRTLKSKLTLESARVVFKVHSKELHLRYISRHLAGR
jgi:hypothetical protein